MPLILTQHYLRDFNRYLDREGVIYHFPKVYLPLVNRYIDEIGDRRFLYQRPVKGAPPGQAGTYFGYGCLGDPVPDTQNAGHWFVDIHDYRAMRPVPFRDSSGIYYETGSERLGNLQGRSIRAIEPMRYFAILAAGQAYSVAPNAAMTESASLQDRGAKCWSSRPASATCRMATHLPIPTRRLRCTSARAAIINGRSMCC